MGINFGKINGINKIYGNQKVEAKKSIQKTNKLESKRDELEISKEALDFQSVIKSLKLAKEIPDIREEVVSPIKEKLEKGTYEVDSKSIAEKMLVSRLNIRL